MNLTTSTKISLKFTLFTTILLFLFGIIVNFFYFSQWYSQEKAFLEERSTVFQLFGFDPMVPKHLRHSWPWDTISLDNVLAKEILENDVLFNISRIDNDYVLYSISWENLSYSVVTYHIFSQLNLLLINFYMIIFFIVLAYFVSHYFVRTSLKRLRSLVSQTKSLDIENLNNPISMDWPYDDEIKILSDTINKSMNKIYVQAKSLKNFISNASHEIKTPLMEISSQLDLISMKYGAKQEISQIKSTIKNMNSLIENLLFLTKIQSSSTDFSIEKFNASNLVNSCIQKIESFYTNKKINIEKKIHDDIYLSSNYQLFEVLVKNLVENAFKYTKNNWNIKIYFDNNFFEIEDDGIWIRSENLQKIWHSFYQEDSAKTDIKSFWMWLYIVKQIIDLLDYDVDVSSEVWNWTKFTIKFNKNENTNSWR